MSTKKRAIWVFGDYRNYFQNRVTLQLLSRAMDLAAKIDAEVCAVVFGNKVDEWVGEYIAHGADKVYLADHPRLAAYSMETYTLLMERLVRHEKPEIILVGATTFGREFASRVAKRLGTGLTADCIGLDIDPEGLLLQRAPSFGGNLVAEIVTPERRPQMATVRPGTFQEIPHDYNRTGKVVKVPLPKSLPADRVRLLCSERSPQREQKLEDAKVVVCGGRGLGSKKKFAKLFELAELLCGEVGATRPVVYADWAEHDALVGQAGKQIRPQILLSFGISGAIQHTAACNDAKFIIAVNKNPNAAMMKRADVAIVADASQICNALIQELKRRIR
ncbi:MAG: electron transfer flavoprotein subunit alpha/FixB family protein [Proteobacteria bacterium]|nr:electron transfer flavoprotein subunit alpha/FixB family protein [Pseudomonadota bacterium]MBU4370735.1 electron transfer flavoprotein subunit alpha/FixB family protein [Pseudomonadota bacterium]MBU4582747.1 electron transfer flavoprotein subunit alpha/FixB family protein [Pseudomonadota bacterium]MCG2739460.1 electron transfer flavoprotein subunit alpha/FixB family protein [Syntrophaceae bacterium]